MASYAGRPKEIGEKRRYVGFYIDELQYRRFLEAIFKEHKNTSQMVGMKLRQLVDDYIHRQLSDKEIDAVDKGKGRKEDV